MVFVDDIVHRNGKTPEGKEIVIDQKKVSELIKSVEEFVQYIDTQLPGRLVGPDQADEPA
jgi:hypothetical protein